MIIKCLEGKKSATLKWEEGDGDEFVFKNIGMISLDVQFVST